MKKRKYEYSHTYRPSRHTFVREWFVTTRPCPGSCRAEAGERDCHGAGCGLPLPRAGLLWRLRRQGALARAGKFHGRRGRQPSRFGGPMATGSTRAAGKQMGRIHGNRCLQPFEDKEDHVPHGAKCRGACRRGRGWPRLHPRRRNGARRPPPLSSRHRSLRCPSRIASCNTHGATGAVKFDAIIAGQPAAHGAFQPLCADGCVLSCVHCLLGYSVGRALHLGGREQGVVASGRVATPTAMYAAAYSTPIPRCIAELAGKASASLWWPPLAVALELRGSWLDHLTAALQMEAKQENRPRRSPFGRSISSSGWSGQGVPISLLFVMFAFYAICVSQFSSCFSPHVQHIAQLPCTPACAFTRWSTMHLHLHGISAWLTDTELFPTCFNIASNTVRRLHGAPRSQAADRRPPHGAGTVAPWYVACRGVLEFRSRWALVRAKNARTSRWRPGRRPQHPRLRHRAAARLTAWPCLTAVAFDPVLWPDALRRHQQLWQIDGPVSCLRCVSEQHTLGPHPSAAVREPEPPEPFDAAGVWISWKTRVTCLLGIHSGQGPPLAVAATIPLPPAPRGHGCGLHARLPAVQDRGLGNVLLAALAPPWPPDHWFKGGSAQNGPWWFCWWIICPSAKKLEYEALWGKRWGWQVNKWRLRSLRAKQKDQRCLGGFSVSDDRSSHVICWKFLEERPPGMITSVSTM